MWLYLQCRQLKNLGKPRERPFAPLQSGTRALYFLQWWKSACNTMKSWIGDEEVWTSNWKAVQASFLVTTTSITMRKTCQCLVVGFRRFLPNYALQFSRLVHLHQGVVEQKPAEFSDSVMNFIHGIVFNFYWVDLKGECLGKAKALSR